MCAGLQIRGQLYKEEGKEGAEITRRVFQGHLVVLLVSMSHKTKSSVKLLLVTNAVKDAFVTSPRRLAFPTQTYEGKFGKTTTAFGCLRTKQPNYGTTITRPFLNLQNFEKMIRADWAATFGDIVFEIVFSRYLPDLAN